jgi:lipoprotein-anchoring transpeptidase ErfK/SrfK
MISILRKCFLATATACLLASCASTTNIPQTCAPSESASKVGITSDPQKYRLVVSVADQRLALVSEGRVLRQFVISTSSSGVSEAPNSNGTPRGRHAIAEKIGACAPIGMVFESRMPTGKIVAPYSAGGSGMITRILRLRGLEERNQSTFDRLIYLNGTPAEDRLGSTATGGNVRLRSADIVFLFDLLPVDTRVDIFEEKLDVAMTKL